MAVTKRTRTYTYHTRGQDTVARKRGKKESLLEQGFRKQAKDIKKGAEQLW